MRLCVCACVCVCVCVCERERERVCVCVCVSYSSVLFIACKRRFALKTSSMLSAVLSKLTFFIFNLLCVFILLQNARSQLRFKVLLMEMHSKNKPSHTHSLTDYGPLPSFQGSSSSASSFYASLLQAIDDVLRFVPRRLPWSGDVSVGG